MVNACPELWLWGCPMAPRHWSAVGRSSGEGSQPRCSAGALRGDAAVVATAGTRAKKAGPPPPTSKREMETCSHRNWGQAPPLIRVPWIWMASPGSRSRRAERRMGLLAKGTGDSTAVPCPMLTSDAVSGRLGGGRWWLGCQRSLSCRLLGDVTGREGRRRLAGAVGSAATSGGDIAKADGAQAQRCPGTC